jgi:predicted transcriptional regulator
LHFELSNEDRIRILEKLRVSNINMTGLSKRLELKAQETSRHLSRLEKAKLIVKKPDGTFSITNFGNLVLEKHHELGLLQRYREYFNTHKITDIPARLVSNLGVLRNAEFIDDVMVVMQNMQRIIDEAEEYLLRITDQFMIILLDHFVAATDRGVEYRQLYPTDIKLPPDVKSTVKMREAARKGLFKTHTHENIRVFMILSEKEVGILSFPTLEGKFDYIGFASKDSHVHNWCRELFEKYWEDRLPPISSIWEDIP